MFLNRLVSGGLRSSIKAIRRPFCSKEGPERTVYSVQDFAAIEQFELVKDKIESVLFLHRNAYRVPKNISLDDMRLLLDSVTDNSTLTTFRYLQKRESRERKRLARMVEQLTDSGRGPVTKEGILDENNQPIYGMFNNTLLSITHNANRQIHPHLISAAQFGPPIVFDFSYDHLMSQRSHLSLASQVTNVIAYNRGFREPMDLHFCNFNGDSRFTEKFYQSLNIRDPGEVLITATKRSYLDLFERDRLVYLSPHAENELFNFDPDSIFIIGAFVDRMQHVKHRHSDIKANQNGIRSVRLPLDRYLDMTAGANRCLNVDHVGKIVIDLCNGMTMEEVLEWNVPSRKQYSMNDEKRKLKKRLQKERIKRELSYLKTRTEQLLSVSN